MKSHLPVEEMPFNPFSLNDKYTEEINNLDPTISMPRIEDKYFLDNELNQLIKSNMSHINSFSLHHVNARSLQKNFDTFHHMIDSLEIDFTIIGISETWMSEPSNLTSLETYNFECYGRTHRTGGGVGLYILNDIEYKLRNDINTSYNNYMESTFLLK